MATSLAPAIGNSKGNSFDSAENENDRDRLGISSEAVDKKENFNERLAFYKKPIKKNNCKLEFDVTDTPQEIRRQRILYYQRKNRDASFNAGRKFLQNVLNSDNEEAMEESVELPEEALEDMEIDVSKKKKYKIRKDYARMFMLSEWMLEVPQDFAENWYMVPCPVGKRVLLVAQKGLTRLYTRKGIEIAVLRTYLPGGNHKRCHNSFTILDCIWIPNKKECYVLDVLAWSNQELINCDTDFRFYWLKSQIEEHPELQTIRKGVNDCSVIQLPYLSCDQPFYDCLQNGLLFYHKQIPYTNGRTPLVTWLKVYMLPEVLNIHIPEELEEKPASYVDFETHVLKVIRDEKIRLQNRQKRNEQLDNSLSELEDME
ncbi:hypothetical protein TSAR_003209 [Trichomalopsis sarcophagae]|uniref:Snurportin-1 n=1 Tax=Trichomalopsis sarcophagae TaxID=543379 RepID=A0A232F5M7_9HYME|nr:hypothetical protein TSAR_003209 [Trichomalopsis sarcophagae]